jgi:hypothetical protein
MLCNDPNLPESKRYDVIVREVFNTDMMSKYAYMSIPVNLICPTCGKVGEIVNQCGCDPNNLPTTPKLYRTDNVYYVPDTKVIIDFILSNGLTEFCRHTAEEVAREYGPVKVGNYLEVHRMREETFIKEPIRITKEAWDYAYECLPPKMVRSGQGAFSFLLSELIYGSVGYFFVKMGSEYFKLSARTSITHTQIVEKCKSI